MLGGGVFRLVASHADECDVDLKRRIAEEPQHLSLGDDLRRHEIHHRDPERTNVLMDGPLRGHDEDVLLGKNFAGGQVIRDSNGHEILRPEYAYFRWFGKACPGPRLPWLGALSTRGFGR